MPGHPEPRVAEHGPSGAKPPERQPGRGDQRVCVEHAQQHDVHEEALGGALSLGELVVLQVAGDDARVVGAGTSCAPVGLGDERQPELDRRRRRRVRPAAAQRHRFAAVAQQPLVHRSPPGAARAASHRAVRARHAGACQRMNDSAARRNGRCRGALAGRPVEQSAPSGPGARAGSSRTAATCAEATASALIGREVMSGTGHLKAADDHGVGFRRRVSLTDDRLIRGGGVPAARGFHGVELQHDDARPGGLFPPAPRDRQPQRSAGLPTPRSSAAPSRRRRRSRPGLESSQ